MPLTLITGGVRSGKSGWAEELAGRWGPHVLYVATASLTTGAAAAGRTVDAEMVARIEQHRAQRPSTWITLEEPYDLDRAVTRQLRQNPRINAVLIDCLTLWLSNWLVKTNPAGAQDARQLLERAEATASALASLPCPVVAVTNEVGWGVVPAYPLGRLFRDLAGRVNQIFARRAESVYVVWAGIPVEIKALDARGKQERS